MLRFCLLFWMIIAPMMYVDGQEDLILRTFHDSIGGSISLKEGTFTNVSKVGPVGSDAIRISNAHIKNGDLIIDFEMRDIRRPGGKRGLRKLFNNNDRQVKDLNIRLSPFVTSSSGESTVAKSQYIDLNPRIEGPFKRQQFQIDWNNFQDDYRLAEGPANVHVIAELIGISPVNCQDEPVFKFTYKWQIVHYWVGVSSVGIGIAGLLKRKSSDDLYAQYRNEVFEGVENANETLNMANSSKITGESLMYMGLGLFAVNAGVLLTRFFSYKGKAKQYNYYCNPKKKLRVEPYMETAYNQTSIGIQLAYKF